MGKQETQMVDIVPELLQKIKKDFAKALKGRTIIELKEQAIDSDSYEDAEKYADEVGKILSECLRRYVVAEELPDGKMYYNIASRIMSALLLDEHNEAIEVAEQVQENINARGGIGLKAITGQFNSDRAKGIIERLALAEGIEEISWIFDEPIKNFAMAAVDDTAKQNADFQSEVGLKPIIIRTAEANCCPWCSALAGTYESDKAPADVWKRHENCRCVINYKVRR